MLRGTGTGALEAMDMDASGLAIDGQVRHMKMLHGPNGERLVVVARNNNTLQVLRVRKGKRG